MIIIFFQLTANVIFFRLLFHADARPTDPMFFVTGVQGMETGRQTAFAAGEEVGAVAVYGFHGQSVGYDV